MKTFFFQRISTYIFNCACSVIFQFYSVVLGFRKELLDYYLPVNKYKKLLLQVTHSLCFGLKYFLDLKIFKHTVMMTYQWQNIGIKYLTVVVIALNSL